jgi:hypothetical protein
MEDSTGAAGRADDPRDPRVVLFEQLDGQTATAQSYFAMDLVERLANELGITS